MAAKKSRKSTSKTQTQKSIKKTAQKIAKEVTKTGSEVQNITAKANKNIWTKLAVGLFIVLIGILLIDLLVQVYYNSPAAMVNGSRISYSKLDERLRQSYAKETIENLINEEVVMQEAKKQDVEIEDEQINKEYDNYAASFPGGEKELLEQLKEQNLDKNELLRRIEITLLVNKLVEGEVEDPTEEEIKSYYDLKYSYLAEENRPAYDSVKAEIKAELIQSNLQEEIPTWLEEVKTGSKIRNNVADNPQMRIFGLTADLLKSLGNRVTSLFSGRK